MRAPKGHSDDSGAGAEGHSDNAGDFSGLNTTQLALHTYMIASFKFLSDEGLHNPFIYKKMALVNRLNTWMTWAVQISSEVRRLGE
ncbi:5461_t:CDS:2 [Paraglomus brasilianum]|uniref:5461_t:CDS:1 n=1 Tax=Paraglomus brasilianum TaxID=144538 RepID=A0A9N8VEZ1_9GLOM|nr:5461_t:CDS:2 [Paraglomus brasilianum]